jgi:hypothetical protein
MARPGRRANDSRQTAVVLLCVRSTTRLVRARRARQFSNTQDDGASGIRKQDEARQRKSRSDGSSRARLVAPGSSSRLRSISAIFHASQAASARPYPAQRPPYSHLRVTSPRPAKSSIPRPSITVGTAPLIARQSCYRCGTGRPGSCQSVATVTLRGDKSPMNRPICASRGCGMARFR